MSFIKKIGLYNELKAKAEKKGSKNQKPYDPKLHEHTREL